MNIKNTNMWKFVLERFPLKVSLPLAAILCIASLCIHSYNVIDLIVCFVSIFASLLILRAIDDISSIGIDKIKSPNRGLPSGKINPHALKKGILLLTLLTIVINFNFNNINKVSFWLVVVMSVYYFLFYKNIKKVPVLIKSLFSNLIFACIPVYTSFVAVDKFTFKSFLLGVFIYVSVIAHEYAHNVGEQGKKRYGLTAYTDIIGNYGTAVLSFSCFIGAFVSGILFWISSGTPILFLICLMITMLHIVILAVRLLNEPSLKNSKPFYVYGFTFFLLPLVVLIICKFLY